MGETISPGWRGKGKSISRVSCLQIALWGTVVSAFHGVNIVLDEQEWLRKVEQSKGVGELMALIDELPSPDYWGLALSNEDRLHLLKFCVRPEKLEDPARWCNEHRALHAAIKAGPKSVAEVEALDEISERLATEAGFR